jgi:hypothetical protein
MDDRERKQIQLLLEQIDELARNEARDRIRQIYSGRSKTKTLMSSMTVQDAISTFEELGRKYVDQTIEDVAAVAKDVGAFAVINEAVDRFLAHLTCELDGVFKMALGGTGAASRASNFSVQLMALWKEARGRVERQLEIHRYSFTNPPPKEIESKVGQGNSSETSTRPENRGRPPAEFWDRLWAATAYALYNGDLDPKRQADIEQAMAEWLAANDLTASPSNIRKRARILWQLIEFERI